MLSIADPRAARPLSAGALACFYQLAAHACVAICGGCPSLNELTDPQRSITIGINDAGHLFQPPYREARIW